MGVIYQHSSSRLHRIHERLVALLIGFKGPHGEFQSQLLPTRCGPGTFRHPSQRKPYYNHDQGTGMTAGADQVEMM